MLCDPLLCALIYCFFSVEYVPFAASKLLHSHLNTSPRLILHTGHYTFYSYSTAIVYVLILVIHYEHLFSPIDHSAL